MPALGQARSPGLCVLAALLAACAHKVSWPSVEELPAYASPFESLFGDDFVCAPKRPPADGVQREEVERGAGRRVLHYDAERRVSDVNEMAPANENGGATVVRITSCQRRGAPFRKTYSVDPSSNWTIQVSEQWRGGRWEVLDRFVVPREYP